MIDAAGRRIGKRIEGALVKGWLYQNGLSPLAELDGSGQLVSRFVYGTRAHVPDYMVRGGVTYRIVSDRLGSPRVVVDAATGAIAQELRYDEYGRITLDTNPGFQPFGFAGGLQRPGRCAPNHPEIERMDFSGGTGICGAWVSWQQLT